MSDRPVMFYVFCRSHPVRDALGGMKWARPVSPPFFHSPGFDTEVVPLPAELPDWKRYDLTISPDRFPDYYSDILIPESEFDAIPDIVWLCAHQLASAKARAVIDRHAPGSVTWIPVNVRGEESGRLVPGEHQIFVPRTFLYVPDTERMIRPDIDFDPLLANDLIHDLQTNPAAQDYAKQLPLWGIFPSRDKSVFRPDLFAALRSAGVTGLEERESEYWLHYDGEETVGHIFASEVLEAGIDD